MRAQGKPDASGILERRTQQKWKRTSLQSPGWAGHPAFPARRRRRARSRSRCIV